MVTTLRQSTVGTQTIYIFIGKASDKKPMGTNGSKFIEMDTGREFYFDGDEQGWFIQGARYLDSIEITTPPTKTTYYVGESVDLSGIAVVAHYVDGSSESVSEVELVAPEKLELDSEVKIKYVENGRTRYADIAIEIKSNEASDTESFIDIVQNAPSVILTNDIAATESITINKDFVLDLNGHAITSDMTCASGKKEDYFIVANGANVTIKGGDIRVTKPKIRVAQAINGGTITIENGHFISDVDVGITAVGAGSKVIFNDGQINAVEGGLMAFDGAALEINGGKIIVSDNFPIGTNGTANRGGNTIIVNGGYFEGNIVSNGYEAICFYIANNDIVTINGGEFRANNGAGICMRGGTVVINDAKIISTGVAGGGGGIGDKKMKMSQSAIIYDEKSNYPGHVGMSLTINGGTFVGYDHSVDILPGDTEPNVTINGGAFVPPIA